METAVPDGFVEISAGLAVQRGQPAMRGDQARKHAEASLKCEHGTLTVTQSSQGDAEIEMAQREKMLQPNGQQCLLGSLFVSALSQQHHGETEMRLRTVTIDV
jgi:hypothetical protein